MKSEHEHEERKRNRTLYRFACKGAMSALDNGGPIEAIAALSIRTALHEHMNAMLALPAGPGYSKTVHAAMDKFAMHELPRRVIRDIVDPQPDAEHAAIAAGAALFVVTRSMGFGDAAPVTILGCGIDQPDPEVGARIDAILNGLEKRKRDKIVTASKKRSIGIAEYHMPCGADAQRTLVLSVLSRYRSDVGMNARRRLGEVYLGLISEAEKHNKNRSRKDKPGSSGTDWCSN